MRRAALVLAAALLAACAPGRAPLWELPPAPIRTGPVVDEARLQRGTLSNGVELLVFEDARLPLVAFGLVARRGAGSEPLEHAGVATFTAELMERGAGERDALALARAVDDLGASLEVGVGWDETMVQLAGLSRDLETLWDVLADVALRPRFTADEAGRVRAELLAAIEKSRDEPRALAQRALLRTLYPGHRYGLPVEGSSESVASLRPEDARGFHAGVFRPENAIVYAAGDVSFERVRALAEASFGDWPAGPLIEPAPAPAAPAPPERRVVVVERPDLVQAQLLLGHDGIARTEGERVPIGMMARVLGQSGFNSRLMSRVRKDEGLTYGIYANFTVRRQPGPFVVATFTRVAEVGRVVEIVLAELERMAAEPATPDELDAVQRQSAAGFVLGLETAGAVVDALVDLDVHGLPRDSLDTYRGRVVAVDGRDLARVARERLHPERIAIVAVGPADALVPQLERFGPVEVVDP